MIFTAPHQAQNPETLRAVVVVLLFMYRSNHVIGEGVKDFLGFLFWPDCRKDGRTPPVVSLLDG